jgi:hypothetical protein
MFILLILCVLILTVMLFNNLLEEKQEYDDKWFAEVPTLKCQYCKHKQDDRQCGNQFNHSIDKVVDTPYCEPKFKKFIFM